MMQQYLQVKEQYKDCIVFFRLGDFYECFGMQSLHQELEITLREGTADWSRELPCAEFRIIPPIPT